MFVELDRTGTLDGLEKTIKSVTSTENVHGLLILASAENCYIPEKINPVLTQVPIPLCGGTFPSIIYKNKKLDKGAIVVGLSGECSVKNLSRLSEPGVNYEQVIDRLMPGSENAKTMIIFVDALSDNISHFLDGIFNVFGMEVNYIGAGTGSKTLNRTPSIITNDGIICDSAVMMLTDLKSNISVSHGWHSISGPYQVTETAGKTIKTLNWRPAFDVYSEIIEEHSGKILTSENFFRETACYPIGMARIDSERILRSPLATSEDGSIVFINNIPKGSLINFMTTDRETLIKAAGKLASDAPSSEKEFFFFIDCLARSLYLKENFDQELNAVYREGQLLAGICALGEIANNSNDYLELYNMTSVMGIFKQ